MALVEEARLHCVMSNWLVRKLRTSISGADFKVLNCEGRRGATQKGCEAGGGTCDVYYWGRELGVGERSPFTFYFVPCNIWDIPIAKIYANMCLVHVLWRIIKWTPASIEIRLFLIVCTCLCAPPPFPVFPSLSQVTAVLEFCVYHSLRKKKKNFKKFITYVYL